MRLPHDVPARPARSNALRHLGAGSLVAAQIPPDQDRFVRCWRCCVTRPNPLPCLANCMNTALACDFDPLGQLLGCVPCFFS
jgi:hypothetical protein